MIVSPGSTVPIFMRHVTKELLDAVFYALCLASKTQNEAVESLTPPLVEGRISENLVVSPAGARNQEVLVVFLCSGRKAGDNFFPEVLVFFRALSLLLVLVSFLLICLRFLHFVSFLVVFLLCFFISLVDCLLCLFMAFLLRVYSFILFLSVSCKSV
jgi:hypothetical protein